MIPPPPPGLGIEPSHDIFLSQKEFDWTDFTENETASLLLLPLQPETGFAECPWHRWVTRRPSCGFKLCCGVVL